MNNTEQFIKREKMIVLEYDITLNNMMEESLNEEHADKNEILNENGLDNIKRRKITTPNIISTDTME